MSQFSVVLVLVLIRSLLGDEGAPYGLINRIQTECEMSSMTFGTRLSDAFNSLDESTEKKSRKSQDYLVEHLGFASSSDHAGLWKEIEMSADGQTITHLQKRGGWIGHKNISHSSYWALENKWVYLVGDLTQAQLWSAMVSPFLGADVVEASLIEQLKGSQCSKQSHRSAETSLSDDKHLEVTCHAAGFGPQGKLTYDWKHSPYNEYDHWLWGEEGPWSSSSSSSSGSDSHSPDILVLQFGSHTCMEGVLMGAEVNETMIKEHEQQIPMLMNNVSAAIARARSSGRGETLVVVSTASRVMNSDPRTSFCMWRINRIIAHEAHLRGFPVLEREELEHRLFFKSEHSPELIQFTNASMHLTPPAPQLVATMLLNLVSCLTINGTRALVDVSRHHHHHHAQHWGALGAGVE